MITVELLVFGHFYLTANLVVSSDTFFMNTGTANPYDSNLITLLIVIP